MISNVKLISFDQGQSASRRKLYGGEHTSSVTERQTLDMLKHQPMLSSDVIPRHGFKKNKTVGDILSPDIWFTRIIFLKVDFYCRPDMNHKS